MAMKCSKNVGTSECETYKDQKSKQSNWYAFVGELINLTDEKTHLIAFLQSVGNISQYVFQEVQSFLRLLKTRNHPVVVHLR